ncbi:MAG: hypothetical protein ACJ8H8_02525, partial [Geminicoccaceae bacterium]
MLARPAAAAMPSPVLVPEHEEASTILEPAPGQVRDHFPWQVPSPFEPEPATWLLGKVPAGQHPYWSEVLLQDRTEGNRRLLRYATSLHVVEDKTRPLPLIFPHLYAIERPHDAAVR